MKLARALAIVTASVLAVGSVPAAAAAAAAAPGAETLDRGLISAHTTTGNFLSWQLLAADTPGTAFNDARRELLDGTHIDKYNTGGDTRLLTASGVHSNNGTKSTPTLSADILGDWREEVIWPTTDNRALRVFSTTDPTNISHVSLLQDRQYREAIAWQNTAYNQPPHPSFAMAQ
jgi:rhamnogalacturonan endolyase